MDVLHKPKDQHSGRYLCHRVHNVDNLEQLVAPTMSVFGEDSRRVSPDLAFHTKRALLHTSSLYEKLERVETQTRSPSIYKGQTLGSFVNPLTAHSPIVDGALIEQALACSTKGSLMMLTVKPFPDLMLLVVSLTRSGPLEHEMETVGGLAVTMLNQLRGH